MKQKWLEKIREGGLHLTPLKEKILTIFEKGHEPLSVANLLKQLRRYHLAPHKTSLYRELEALVETEILEEAKLHEGIQTYELKEEHHHHFICELCNEVLDFEMPELEDSIKKMETQLNRKGVAIKTHSLNLYGHCSTCKTKKILAT